MRHSRSGARFIRGHSIGPCILDFAIRGQKPAVEIDGDTHCRQLAYDAARTTFLETQGCRVIRFANADVMMNADGVPYSVMPALASSPFPGLLPDGKKGQKDQALP